LNFRKPGFFGLLILIILSLQVAMSYLSVRFLWNGEWAEGIIFFLGVIALGCAMAYYVAWLRRGKMPR
jgi:hypothetical protein